MAIDPLKSQSNRIDSALDHGVRTALDFAPHSPISEEPQRLGSQFTTKPESDTVLQRAGYQVEEEERRFKNTARLTTNREVAEQNKESHDQEDDGADGVTNSRAQDKATSAKLKLPREEAEAKSVTFELLLPEPFNKSTKMLQILPHHTTESIVTAVKSIYGLYAHPNGPEDVTFRDGEGYILIPQYENLTNTEVVYVQVTDEHYAGPRKLSPVHGTGWEDLIEAGRTAASSPKPTGYTDDELKELSNPFGRMIPRGDQPGAPFRHGVPAPTTLQQEQVPRRSNIMSLLNEEPSDPRTSRNKSVHDLENPPVTNEQLETSERSAASGALGQMGLGFGVPDGGSEEERQPPVDLFDGFFFGGKENPRSANDQTTSDQATGAPRPLFDELGWEPLDSDFWKEGESSVDLFDGFFFGDSKPPPATQVTPIPPNPPLDNGYAPGITTEPNLLAEAAKGRLKESPYTYPPQGRFKEAEPIATAVKARSKTGCITCRRRRRKCDGSKPSCELI